MISTDSRELFRQLGVGEELPHHTAGPITGVHLMRWSSAIENWHRIHYDLPFATEHEGLPGLLINGSWKQHFLLQMLRRWAGPGAWVSKVGFQFRSMDVAGATLTAWGRVTALEEKDGLGYADLEIGIRDQSGREGTLGSATVVFPAERDVPYPYAEVGV
ncbi:acyl dehydratase [Rhodococcoides fascians]|uniref:acyl dehydratase n=1 Tax=Rhodococcoides fascians TaxID=1828 RepID=UPI0006910EC8|nr:MULTISPECIES: acyl dehydratase [Rhodococcus]OZF01378.1 acyl dehydratase [Rhodococcus sp. 15-1189-1-1a]OZF15548.1 acyl dehydratase [Rhodococcus sp. 14-2686-1-2]